MKEPSEDIARHEAEYDRLDREFQRQMADPTSETRKRYEAMLAKRLTELQPICDAVSESQRITAEDLAVTINYIP